MKKMLFALLVVGVVTSAGARPASAQSYPALVNVPFDFIVAGRMLPAGSYRITVDDSDPTLLLIASTHDTRIAAFAATATAVTASRGNALVTFRKIDGHMFLAGVATPGGEAREIAMTTADAEATLARLHLVAADGHGDSVK